jgi:outer membrane biosynthesis protein TonB
MLKSIKRKKWTRIHKVGLLCLVGGLILPGYAAQQAQAPQSQDRFSKLFDEKPATELASQPQKRSTEEKESRKTKDDPSQQPTEKRVTTKQPIHREDEEPQWSQARSKPSEDVVDDKPVPVKGTSTEPVQPEQKQPPQQSQPQQPNDGQNSDTPDDSSPPPNQQKPDDGSDQGRLLDPIQGIVDGVGGALDVENQNESSALLP